MTLHSKYFSTKAFFYVGKLYFQPFLQIHSQTDQYNQQCATAECCNVNSIGVQNLANFVHPSLVKWEKGVAPSQAVIAACVIFHRKTLAWLLN